MEPQKFLSHKTGNANKNRGYYFTNPIPKLFPKISMLIKKVDEKYTDKQTCRKIITECVSKLVMDKIVNVNEADHMNAMAFEDMNKQLMLERNKELLNPAWVAYREQNEKPIAAPKSKANDNQAIIFKVMKENEEHLKTIAELKQLLKEFQTPVPRKKCPKQPTPQVLEEDELFALD